MLTVDANFPFTMVNSQQFFDVDVYLVAWDGIEQ
jgi:hypothetical protein